jgi:hypothetical protein
VQVHQLLHFLAGLLEHPKAKVSQFNSNITSLSCVFNSSVLLAEPVSFVFFSLGNVLQDGCCEDTIEHSRKLQAALYKLWAFQLEDSFNEVLGSHL